MEDENQEFDPLTQLDADETARYNKIKDDPAFAQMFTDIDLIRKIQNGQRAFNVEKQKKQDEIDNPTKSGVFSWLQI